MPSEVFKVLLQNLEKPINIGGPTIMETVKEWIIFNPEGTKEQCALETGVKLEILEQYWAFFVAASDIPSDEMSSLTLLASWIRQHPNGSRYACFKDIHLRFDYITEHWVECGGNASTSKAEENKEIIRNWIEAHPEGTMHECYRDTKISRATIAMVWPENKNNDSYSTLAKKKHIERVSKWIKENPNGRLAECYCELGLTRRHVEEVWYEAGGTEDKIKNKRDLQEEEAIQRITEWINNNKDGGLSQCAVALGMTKKAVNRFWETCGGSSLSVYERQKVKIDEIIKEWLALNPLGTMKECMDDTGFSQLTVSRRWEKLGGKTHKAVIAIKISDYLVDHPEGTMAECARMTGLSPSTMYRYFKKCKDPEFCQDMINTSGEHNKNKILISNWIATHPNGTIQECADDLEIHRTVITRCWSVAGGKDVTQTHKEYVKVENTKESALKRVSNWLKDNPRGLQKQCIAETGLSSTAVRKVWKMAGGGHQSHYEKEKQQAEIDEWFHNNPNGTYAECSKAIGVSKSLVSKRGRQLGIYKKRYVKNFETLKKWLEENPYGLKEVCQRETGLPYTFICKHWVEAGGMVEGKSECMYLEAKPILDEWWNNHPDGTLRQCYKETRIGRRRVRRYLEELNTEKNNE